MLPFRAELRRRQEELEALEAQRAARMTEMQRRDEERRMRFQQMVNA